MVHAWFCPECGSEDIEYQAWAKLNTGELGEAVDGEEDWCCNCEERITALFTGDFVEEHQEGE